ncbi:MAG TPA: CoA-transferase [Acidimicrobiales bacterium]|nr:CoA-transferase [Acidimicrobiales bacterium]
MDGRGAMPTAAGLEWTPGEMLAAAAASFITSDDVVLVGLGLPQVAAQLAQRTHAPGMRMLLEIGVFAPCPREPSAGIADPRMWSGASAYGGVLDVLGTMLHGGRVTLGLLGALQVDGDGSINTTLVHDRAGRTRRFNGSGGGNDVASLAERVLVVMRHDPRKFAPALDFLTSPGRRVNGRARGDVGLAGRGTVAVVTDRAVLEIGDQGPVLASVHPGEDVDAVLADTPLTVHLPPGGPARTDPPTAEQCRVVREELDPKRWYTA